MAIINKEEFEERLEMLTPEVMAEVIDIFKETYPERKQNIQKAIGQKDPKKLEFEIHALKNDLSQFGAEQLFNNTQSILEKVRESSSTEFQNDIENLTTQIDKELIPELDEWYKKQS